jgi:Na+-driven multidrug efflux pump
MSAALMRALGDSKTPLFFLMFSCLLNIILDAVFIVVLDWGTAGAGWATVISMSFAAVLCLIHIRRSFPMLRFTRDMRFCRERSRTLLNNGIGMALQFSITGIGIVILQREVNKLEEIVVSALGMASRIQVFIMQPMEALGVTMATFCAQNLGAGKLLRIKHGIRLGFAAVLIYSVAAGLLIVFFGRYLAVLFVGRGEENLETALSYIAQYQLVNGSLYWLLGILFIVRNSVQGLGYSKVTMLAGVSELIARAGIALILVPFFGFNAIVFANPLAWLFADIILIITFVILMKRLSKLSRSELKELRKKPT